MEKKRIVVLSLLLVAFVGLVLGVNAFANPDEEYEKMYSMGAFEKSRGKSGYMDDTLSGTVVYKGKNVTITAEEIERIIGQARAAGMGEGSDSHIIAFAIRNEVLYCKAVEAGISVSDDEISAAIEQERAGVELADNYSDFKAYLDGLGKTADEYWESCMEDRIYLRNLVIGKYLEGLRQQMLETGLLSSNDEWQDKLKEISVEAVKDEEIKSVENGETIEIEIDGTSYSIKGK